MPQADSQPEQEQAHVDNPQEVINKALDMAREITGMELAFVGRFQDGQELIETAKGDASAFGFRPGSSDGIILEDTYCQRMSDGRLPNLINDTQAHPVTAQLDITRDSNLGAYLGVPLTLSDGRSYGAFCCVSRSSEHGLSERDVEFMRVLARLVADQLEKIEAENSAQRLQEEFFASLSHDLQNPLTAIQGYTTLLAEGEGGELNPLGKQSVEVIERQTLRLSRMVDDLLFLSQQRSGIVSMERNWLELGEVVSEALSGMHAAARAKQIRLVSDFGPERLPMYGDSFRLGQLVANLLSNAIKYTPQGGTVSLRLQADGSTALLTVSDDGIGVPPQETAFLFQRFFRASSAKERGIKGTGLGLSICQAIVAEHAGTISVESELGQGTSFAVRLPLAPDQPEG